MSWKNELELTVVNKTEDLSSAHYALDYSKALKKYKKGQRISLQIISELVGNKDVIIQLKSNLLDLTDKKSIPERVVLDFITEIKKLKLDYRYRKMPYHSSGGGLFQLFSGKKEVFEVLIYVPNEIWYSASFQQILPQDGLRYYISDINNNNPLDDMQIMTDSEMLKIFQLIIFDCKKFARMGINSIRLEISDIKELLGI